MTWKLAMISLLLLLIGLPVLYLVFIVVMSRAIRHTDIFPFERTIPVAFEAFRPAGESDRFTFVCRGFDCDEVLPRIGPATKAECKSYMAPWGACCSVWFTRGDGSEVHIYSQGSGKYKLTLTPPMCKEPATESSTASETTDGREWIHCDELPEQTGSEHTVRPRI